MAEDTVEAEVIERRPSWVSEDWLAVWCGALLLLVSFVAVWAALPGDFAAQVDSSEAVKISSALKGWLGAPGAWAQNPIESFLQPATADKPAANLIPGVLGAAVGIG